LDSFLCILEQIEILPDEKGILRIVKDVVIKFNELNEKYDYFIETLEREELCEFIDEALRTIGYNPKGDITEKWREW